MYSSVTFYNHYGNGDLFNSRGFLKALAEKFPTNNYYYAHAKPKPFFFDLDWIKEVNIEPWISDRQPYYIRDNNLYINTWIGRESRFVLPGIGCTIDNYLKMFNELSIKLTGTELDKQIENYFPSLDYSKLDVEYTKRIEEFVSNHEDFILISDGDVQSNQAYNFDFAPVISELGKLTTSAIVSTNATQSGAVIKSANQIIQKPGFNLNEISYLSTFCRYIIGRSSGPFAMAQVEENITRSDTTFLSFCYTGEGSSFYSTTKSPSIKAKFLWSPAIKTSDVVKEIIKSL